MLAACINLAINYARLFTSTDPYVKFASSRFDVTIYRRPQGIERGEQMSTDNLIIEHLRAMRTEIAAVKSDTADTRQRLVSVEMSIVDMRRNVVHVFEDIAHQQLIMDKLLDRVQRIERRLALS